MLSNRMKGNMALLFTAMIWGSGFIAQKLGMGVLPPLAFNGFRQLFAAVVMLPVLAINLRKTGYMSIEKNSPEELQRKRKYAIKSGCVCGLFLALGTNLQQIGLVTVSAGKSGFITAIYIVLVPLISLLFGEKFTLKIASCCTLAMVGFAFLSLRGGLGNVTGGDIITLASAFFFACQIVAVNRYVTDESDLLLSCSQFAFTGITTVLVSLLIESYTVGGVMACMPIILYATIFPTAIGYTFQVVGQKYTDATTASFLMSLESVFSVVFGALFLAESMSGRELIGCALIFLANILVQIELPARKQSGE